MPLSVCSTVEGDQEAVTGVIYLAAAEAMDLLADDRG
jgi:hypothetical protein